MSAIVKIGIIGDYNEHFIPHKATNDALDHASKYLGIKIEIQWLPTALLEQNVEKDLKQFNALWCAPGSPYQSLKGALKAIQFAREYNWPFIGTCGGCQHVVIEYARNVLGFQDAEHAEYNPYGSSLFISALPCSLVGKTMRINLKPNSIAYSLYQSTVIQEQYYCNFGINPAYQALIHEGGLFISGVEGEREARILELPNHNFFIATLFVPQLTSSPDNPHPLIVAYLEHAARFKK